MLRGSQSGKAVNRSRLLARNPRMSGSEIATTAAAAATVSTSLYLREGADYLAQGVVGDVVGFAILAVPLSRGRRFRHEALVCLGMIGIVRAVDPSWPLTRSSSFWWRTVAAGLVAYTGLRGRALARRD